jgi:hypothetical protein
MLPYDRQKVEPNADALRRYFGTDEWRAIYDARGSESQSPEMYRNMEALYKRQLERAGWKYVVETRYVRRVGDAALYKLLLASKNRAAMKFGNWSAKKQREREAGPSLFD